MIIVFSLTQFVSLDAFYFVISVEGSRGRMSMREVLPYSM